MKRFGLILVLLSAVLEISAFSQTADYYVAPSGNDNNAGTLQSPFATFDKARQAVQTLKQNSQGRTTPIVVMFRGGTYFLPATEALTSNDSGTSSLGIVYQNYPNERAVISGGVRLTGWANVGGNAWQITLPQSTQYFEALYYNGQRRLRPRLGNKVLGTYYRVADNVYLGSNGDPNCPTYVQGKGYQCYDRFKYYASDPISNGWANLNAPFPTGDIELVIFEKFGVSKLRIKSIDTTQHIIYLTGPTDFPASPGMSAGFVKDHRYVIENVKDQLAQGGQWFLDRSVNPWVLTYLANPGENPNTDNVIIPQLPQVMTATDLQYTTFSGLAYAHDNWTIPDVGYPSYRDDVYVPGAVGCYNCQHVTFDGVIITKTTGDGIDITTTDKSSTTAHNVFQNGAIYDVGVHGIRVGTVPAYGDTDANVPQFTVIQNNVIEAFGRIIPTGFGIAAGTGHDNTFTHNDIYDGYHSGIQVCSWNCPPGNSNSRGVFNITSSFNHIYNLGQGITNDFGCIYYAVLDATGNKILNNKCHDVTDASTLDADGYAGQGLYLDNGTSNVVVQNNLVYRVSDSNVAQTCGATTPGNPNIITNNILAFGRQGAKQQGCAAASSGVLLFNFAHNLIFFDNGRPEKGCNYCYGGNCAQNQNFTSNMYCYGPGNNCTPNFYIFHTSDKTCTQTNWLTTFQAWQNLGEDTTSYIQDPMFVNPYYPADNFNLQQNSPVGKIGFVPFDESAPGRTNVVLKPPSVSATFVTSPLPPTSY
jgi:hypothetical protein